MSEKQLKKIKMNIDQKIKKILEILKERHWTIGVMESCTGGAMANCITNIPGASDVFECGLVTYCNEAKIKAGVDKEIIKKWGVYSIEVAEEMAKKTIGNVGVGVTGNLPGNVFVAVRIETNVESRKLKVESNNKDKIEDRLGELRRVEARIQMKKQVVERVIEMLIENI